jgi:hypothetical protein
MPDAAPPPPTLADALTQRIARRADPVLPDQSPAAVAARLDHWLRTTHGQRNSLRRSCLTQMLLLLLAQPEAATPALHAAGGVGARSGVRAMRLLADWGYLTHVCRLRTRYHRLTAAAEDALLPVVAG